MLSNPAGDPKSISEPVQPPQGPHLSSETATNSTPEDIRHQVEQEQALSDAQKRLKEVEDEVGKLKGEKQALQGEKAGAISTTSQLRTQLSAIQSSHHKSTSELAVLQTRADAIESEKREILEEIERLQQRSNRNTQELFTLRSQRAEASQKIAHLGVEVSELKMALDSVKFNQERSVQALTGARAEVLNLSKAAVDIEERFGKYRAEKQADIIQLQVEHDSVIYRLTSTDNLYRSLQRTYNDQSRRLADAHANIATLTSAAASKKASTSMEFHRLMEENRVLEKRGDDARTSVVEREAELERMAESWDEKERMWEERCKKEERMRRDAERRAEDLKVVVERLAMAGGEGADISPAAALASGMRQTGKTYTQFYTDYTIQEGKLRAAENEVARLTQLVEEISQDIDEKRPLLDEQAVEHTRAIERANALAAELADVMMSRERHEAQAKFLAAAAALHTDEVSSLRITTDDLSRQVQGLLRQLAIRDDPSLADVAIDGSVSANGDIIADRLLEFKSIRSLQEQNQRLLKLTRSLMAKLDAREIYRATSDADDTDTGATLDQATETITKLHAQLLEAQKKMNEATRERDFFSKLLAKGEGLNWSGKISLGPLEGGSDPHQQTITTLQAEMDLVRTKAETDIAEAKEEARLKAEQVGVAEVDKARAEARITLLEEQHRILNDTSGIQKQEFANLESQLRQLQGSISQANNERRVALEQVAVRQAEADRLRNEAANLRAEKEQWTSNESRLQTDFRTVQSERARLQQLIENLNNVGTENERTRNEDRMRLEQRIEELQRDGTALRSQIEQASEATRAAEKRAENLDSRVEAAIASVRAEEDAAKSLVNSRSQEITALTAELEKIRGESENRLRIGNNWRQRATTLQQSQATTAVEHTEAIAAKDKEIADVNGRIAGLNKEIEETKGKLGELERRLADSERGSQLKEGTIQRLQKEVTAARSHVDASAASESLDSAMTTLQDERDALQQRLSQAEKNLEEAKSASAMSAPGGNLPATTDQERREIQQRLDAVQKEKDDLDKKYENDVRQVNRVNANLRNKVVDFQGEKSAADARITQLENELADLRATHAVASSAEGVSPPDQNIINSAVRAAVAAKEAEISQALEKEAELNKALEQARAAVKAEPTDSTPSTTVADTRVAELERERNELKGQVEELQQKVKTLERQARNTEISRKTLERQKAETEARLKKLADGEPAAPLSRAIPESAPTLSSVVLESAATPITTPATEPRPPSAPGASSSTEVPPGSPMTTATTPTRGTVRGRARGVVKGTRAGVAGNRPNPILSAVNATLAQSSTGPLSPTGTKRALPEEDETAQPGQASIAEGTIGSRIQGAATGSGTPERGRVLKRPRGAGPARTTVSSAKVERRPSATGEGSGTGDHDGGQAGSAEAGAESVADGGGAHGGTTGDGGGAADISGEGGAEGGVGGEAEGGGSGADDGGGGGAPSTGSN